MCIRNRLFAQVKLIVIDSIAFHFRQDFQDMAQRTRVLAEMAQKLMHLAEEKDLAVSFCMHLSLFLHLYAKYRYSVPPTYNACMPNLGCWMYKRCMSLLSPSSAKAELA